MAIPEVCQVWIEQRVEEELEDGKSYKAIGREISKEIEKLFEKTVNPDTIRKRASRIANTHGQMSTPQSTPQDNSGIDGNQSPRSHRATGEPKGGSREGSGRKPKHSPPIDKTKIVSESFENAYEAFFKEIREAKRFKWETTSKEAVLERLAILYDVTTIT